MSTVSRTPSFNTPAPNQVKRTMHRQLHGDSHGFTQKKKCNTKDTVAFLSTSQRCTKKKTLDCYAAFLSNFSHCTTDFLNDPRHWLSFWTAIVIHNVYQDFLSSIHSWRTLVTSKPPKKKCQGRFWELLLPLPISESADLIWIDVTQSESVNESVNECLSKSHCILDFDVTSPRLA